MVNLLFLFLLMEINEIDTDKSNRMSAKTLLNSYTNLCIKPIFFIKNGILYCIHSNYSVVGDIGNIKDSLNKAQQELPLEHNHEPQQEPQQGRQQEPNFADRGEPNNQDNRQFNNVWLFIKLTLAVYFLSGSSNSVYRTGFLIILALLIFALQVGIFEIPNLRGFIELLTFRSAQRSKP